MAVPFSVTIRSIEKDHPKTVMLILSIAIIFMGAWNIWFFFAKISVYETSMNVQIAEQAEKIVPSFSGPGRVKHIRQNHIIASFPLNMIEFIYKGQRAIFYPAIKHGEISGAIRTVVTKISSQKDKTIQVRLNTIQNFNYPNQIQLHPGGTGVIKLEVEQVSPFRLLLRKLNTSSVRNYQ